MSLNPPSSRIQPDESPPEVVDAVQAEEAEPWEAPELGRWVGRTGFGLTVLAVIDAVYLTIAHYTTTSVLMCPGNSVINCAKVTTSPESTFLGAPVAVLGLIFYVVLAVIDWPPLWQRQSTLLRSTRLAMTVGGMAFVLYLVYSEVVLIGNICLYCTVIHVLTLALFGLTVYATSRTGLRAAPPV